MEQIKTVKSGDISSRKLKKNFIMEEDDKKFIEFRNYVDEMAKNCVLELYGFWAEFTTPIFTQAMLYELTNFTN